MWQMALVDNVVAVAQSSAHCVISTIQKESDKIAHGHLEVNCKEHLVRCMHLLELAVAELTSCHTASPNGA